MLEVIEQAKKGELAENMAAEQAQFEQEQQQMLTQAGLVVPSLPGMFNIAMPMLPIRNVISLDALAGNRLSMRGNYLTLAILTQYQTSYSYPFLKIKDMIQDQQRIRCSFATCTKM